MMRESRTSCFQELARCIGDEDRSTVAGSDPENDSQCSDCESAEDVSEFQGLMEIQTKAQGTAEATKAAKRRWADLVDSDDELLSHTPTDEKVNVCPKSRWADLLDSDADEEPELSELSDKSRLSERSEMPHTKDFAPERVLQQQSQASAANKDFNSKYHGQHSGTAHGNGVHLKDAPRRYKKGSGKGKTVEKLGAYGAGKGVGKSGFNSNSARAKGAGKGATSKLQCQFIIGIEEDCAFHVVKRIIGNGNMRRIAELTCAKLRLRGRGSKFLEGPEQRESTDDLMLCVSCQDKAGFDEAHRLVSELLNDIYGHYKSFCRKTGKLVPDLSIQVHEGYREGSR